MTEEEFIQRSYQYLLSLFPKTCHTCGRVYATLREYVRETSPIGPVVSYDAELGDWHPSDPLGTLALANCACGSTLALTNLEEPLPQIHETHGWIRMESARRGISLRQLLADLRDKVRQRAMADSVDAIRHD
jgi:hypothetical protein